MTKRQNFVSVQERANEIVLNWLCSDANDVIVPSQAEYKRIEQELTKANVFNTIADQWAYKLPGFEHDDLVLFMQLKLYRVLAQQKYDRTKSPKSFFGVVFRNLMRTIAIRMRVAEKTLDHAAHVFQVNTENDDSFYENTEIARTEIVESVLLSEHKLLFYVERNRKSTGTTY